MRAGTATRAVANAVVTVGLALLVPGCGTGDRAPDRVVLVTVDTLRADHLGCYGYPRDTAPFVCELAAAGRMFTNALASGSHTAPTHASLLTSLQPVQHGVKENGQSLDPAVLTMAEIFRDRGFETAAFTSVRFLKNIADGFERVDAKINREGGRYHRPADDTISAALRWIRRRRDTRKFFVWVHLYDVHEYQRPDTVDADALRRIRDLPVSGHEMWEFLSGEHATRFERFDPDALMTHITHYDAQILFVDRQLRRLHERLAEMGLEEGTLWVVTADHGEGLGSHGYLGHGRYLYNEQLRVPLVMHTGGTEGPAARIGQLVRHVDLLPTLAELVGGSTEGQIVPVEGTSLVPLLRGASRRDRSGPERLAYAERRPARDHWEPGDLLALQDSRLKYIYSSEGADELYDLREDPLELDNLAGSAAGEVAERLRDRLLSLYAEMSREGENVIGTEVDESMIEELRALGYIQ